MRRDYRAAISLFLQALNICPWYAQAYSNAGLAFDKAGHEAEAIWAGREAAKFALGADSARVQASSYYNIGRIYERHGNWSEALSYYRQAQTVRAGPSYEEAIHRVEVRLP